MIHSFHVLYFLSFLPKELNTKMMEKVILLSFVKVKWNVTDYINQKDRII